jgi:rare lipoprotein A
VVVDAPALEAVARAQTQAPLTPARRRRSAGAQWARGRGRALPCAGLVVLAMLAGCASAPPGAPAAAGTVAVPPRPAAPATDGPPADPPPDLAQQPDPEPKIETLRPGGPNKPYELLGERYVPLAGDLPFEQAGLASWYGRKFHGRRTANGEVFDMYALTAAHPTLPLPSYALVRNPRNGREIVVRVNDRGPFGSRDRIVDLSYAAAVKLGVERGVAPVQLRRLTHDEIRTGRWRGGSPAMAAADAPPRPAGSGPTATAAAGTPVAAPFALAAAPTVEAAPASPGAPPAPSLPAEPAAVAQGSGPPSPAVTAVPAAAPSPAAQSSNAATAAADTPAPRGSGFWVQLGAFARHEGALDLRAQLARELAWLEHALTVRGDRRLYRVQAGPFRTQAEAHGIAERIRATLQTLQPLVLPPR